MTRSLCICLLAAILPTLAPCQSARRLTGKVLLPNGKPAQGAIVKLQNQSKDIRTTISIADGSFQFSRLLTDLDYQVRAHLEGMESNRVRWSHLSSRNEKAVTLRLRPARRTRKASAKPGSSDQFRIGSSGPMVKAPMTELHSSRLSLFSSMPLAKHDQLWRDSAMSLRRRRFKTKSKPLPSWFPVLKIWRSALYGRWGLNSTSIYT